MARVQPVLFLSLFFTFLTEQTFPDLVKFELLPLAKLHAVMW